MSNIQGKPPCEHTVQPGDTFSSLALAYYGDNSDAMAQRIAAANPGVVFRLPAFTRAGAIVPMMHVDTATLDAAGHRRDGGRYEDLVLRVYADEETASSFTVYEDDGDTIDSAVRETRVEQRRDGERLVVTVHGADPVAGLAASRPLIVELVSAFAISGVTVNGDPLPQVPVPSRTERGWTARDTRMVRACIPYADVQQTHAFAFQVAGPAHPTASMLLVCDRAFTDPGEDVYARFVQPLRTVRGPVSEVRLDPSLTYPYMYPQPPDAQRNCPMWTLRLDELEPDQNVRLVFEKRRAGIAVYTNPRELYRSAGPGAYAGELRGSLY